MKYAELNLSQPDALILEPILVEAFNKARAGDGTGADNLRAMIHRLRKTGLLDRNLPSTKDYLAAIGPCGK